MEQRLNSILFAGLQQLLPPQKARPSGENNGGPYNKLAADIRGFV